jgi:hypothetical protein
LPDWLATLAHELQTERKQNRKEASSRPAFSLSSIRSLCLFDPAPLLPSRCGEIVGIGGSALTSLWRLSGAQFQVAELLGMQGWPYPRIVLTVLQQMPDDHSELAGDWDSVDVVPATPGNTLIECPQWTVAR